ncbi:MAG: D-Ala-D-Ala carboxypeptidase family metallohydrolase [Candidatus Azambacteria bacterium]|nr:D-Ala-D-Ala carboxypeptidase family metallohydrolase [Candidatus Azambacteria bacterium]
MDTEQLQPKLVRMLEVAQEIAGTGFSITSGFRTVKENLEVGGVNGSSHLTGEAVDIACKNSMRRLRILKALLAVGFTRIGIAPEHIHCDISETRAQNVLWLEN